MTPRLSANDAPASVDFVLEPADNGRLANLCGQFDEHLRQLEQRLGVEINNRANQFRIIGTPEAAHAASELLKELYAAAGSERTTIPLLTSPSRTSQPGSISLASRKLHSTPISRSPALQRKRPSSSARVSKP